MNEKLYEDIKNDIGRFKKDIEDNKKAIINFLKHNDFNNALKKLAEINIILGKLEVSEELLEWRKMFDRIVK